MSTPGDTPRKLQPADWRQDESFTWPERAPWSQLEPQFHMVFGRSDPADPQPEHIQVFGQNGSGKTHVLGKIYQGQAIVRPDRTRIIVATKPVDATYQKIGFPVVHSFDELARKIHDGHRSLIFWPNTREMGPKRRAYHNAKIADLLDRIYVPGSDTDIAIDDWGYAETLTDVKDRLEQFLREGRSSGIGVSGIKQRPQGSNRLTSSESHWTIGFRPKDDADLERWAQLFGSRRDWMPVFRTVRRDRREFIIRNAISGDAYISRVDTPLEPVELPRHRRTLTEALGFPRR